MDVIIIGEHLYNTLGQVRCFGEIGIRPIIIWATPSVYTPAFSRYVGRFFQVSDPEEGVRLMLSQFGNKGRRYVVSTDSDHVMSILDREYDSLSGSFCFFNAGGPGRLSRYLEKYEQCSLAGELGFRVPKTWKVRSGMIPGDLSFPVFAKAADSFDYHWKDLARIIRSREELTAYYDSLPPVEVLLQEFIEKKNELAVEGVSFQGGKELYLPIQGEYIRLPKDGFGTYKRNEAYKAGEELKENIRKMMSRIGYSGVFEMEFLIGQDDALYYLETNFRQTQYNHALADMGANLSRVWYRSCLSGRLETDGEAVRKSPSLVLNEPKDFKTYVATGKIGRWAWLKDVMNADSYYFLDRKDWLYVLRSFLHSVRLNSMAFFRKLSRLAGLLALVAVLFSCVSKEQLVVDLDEDPPVEEPARTIDHPVVDADDPAVLCMRKKAWQLALISWTPLKDMPNKVSYYTAGKGYVGLPYSSVKEMDKFVGMEVSFHTFMTAVHNPRSIIYTDNVSKEPYHGENCGTYYGTVCSTAVCYALGLEFPYQANMLVKLSSFAQVVPQTMSSVCVGDMFWRNGHCILVTHISEDDAGLRHFELLESVGLGTYLRNYDEDALRKVWDENSYVLYRYLDLAGNLSYEPIPFFSNEGDPSVSFHYNDTLCQQRGDRVSYRRGETVRLDVFDLSYPFISLYKDGSFVKDIPVAESVILSELEPGSYSAFLSGEGKESEPTLFEVLDTEVSVSHTRSSYKVCFSSINGEAEYLVVCSTNGARSAILPINAEQREKGERNFWLNGSGKYVKVFFKGEFGRVSNAPLSL